MNLVIEMGRLTRDPEIRYTASGMAIASYTLAVDRRGKKKDGEQTADFIPCKAWDKSAEFAEKYFRQGMRVLVRGRLQTGSYTNKEGVKIHTTEVMVDEQEFADSKVAGQPQKAPAKKDEGFMDIPDNVDDDGLPWG